MNCYLCGKNNLEVIRKKLRYDICRNVLKCQNCGLVYLEPLKKNLSDYYDKEYRIIYGPVLNKESGSEEIFKSYFPFQKENIKQIKDILRPDMRVLDIGCSTGHFLYYLKDLVSERFDIEFNRDHAEFAQKKLGIKVFTEPIEKTNFPRNYFDLISALDLIEHFEDPFNFLDAVKKYLKPGGYLYLKTPNIEGSLISVYKSKPYSDFWFREPHIYYFSSKTLLLILERSGFFGEVKTIQEYNFINQMNWILAGVPQKNVEAGMSEPELVVNGEVGKELRNEFNFWIKKVNKEYIYLLNKHNVGESLVFVGRKNA